ncbi:MAG: sigma-54 dependent transcriptional regulator [Bdellovibrionales bacterium]|nr:sigma-54 dependent transcriptional regulator [Bdellovibrionales bacterium]
MVPYLSKGQGNTLMNDIKDSQNNIKEIVHCSEAIKKLLKMVRKVAPTDSSVLISGNSGTGKEMLARKIHDISYRKNKEFIVINCSCLNENTIESELFGHEKGAFTGADYKKTGILEKANEGTVVLDEIGDLKPRVQTKLLRLLQESEIYRMGSNIPIKLNIRFICCTNKNLAEEVIKGSFREDLYYRINTIAVTVPSLSERPEDIPLLLKHFLGTNMQIDNSAMTTLINYRWPGNVRELKNLCERLRVFQDEKVIKISHLPEELMTRKKQSPIPYDPGMTLAELNKLYILNALEHFPSKRQAAKALGITVKTLYNRLHEYGVFEQHSLHYPVRRRDATV